jgi:hypothetical protein
VSHHVHLPLNVLL